MTNDCKNGCKSYDISYIIFAIFGLLILTFFIYLYSINIPVYTAYHKGYDAGLIGTEDKYQNCTHLRQTWYGMHNGITDPHSMLFMPIVGVECGRLMSITPNNDYDNIHAYAMGYIQGYEDRAKDSEFQSMIHQIKSDNNI